MSGDFTLREATDLLNTPIELDQPGYVASFAELPGGRAFALIVRWRDGSREMFTKEKWRQFK